MTKIVLKMHVDNQIQAQYKKFWLIKVWEHSWDDNFYFTFIHWRLKLFETAAHVNSRNIWYTCTPILESFAKTTLRTLFVTRTFSFLAGQVWEVPILCYSCIHHKYIKKKEKKLCICLHQNKLLLWYVDLIMELYK